MESAPQIWLTRQCELIRGVTRGALVLAEGGGPSVVASWPRGADSEAFVSTAITALTQRRVVTWAPPARGNPGPGSPESGAPPCHVAVPISLRSRAGAVVVEVQGAKPSELEPIGDLLQLGSRWLELLAARDTATTRLCTSLELVGTALRPGDFPDWALALVTEFATRLDCERVSLGTLGKAGIRVVALSHNANFDERVQLIRDLTAAMNEAVDQDAAIVHPQATAAPARIAREHEALVQRQGMGAALTVPMSCDGRLVGAICLERKTGRRFDASTVGLCEDVVALLGPSLALRWKACAGWLERCRTGLTARISELLGPGHATTKLVAALLVVGLAALGFARSDYRVTAEATLEGRVQRAIVAGLDGYIAEANVRAGDVVSRAQVLGRLDDRDLQLEHRKWTGRREQLRQEVREALAIRDRAQLSIISARIAQASAQLELLEESLHRTRLVAPFDGVVVRGDLSQSLGSPVERGDVLFEIAPLDGYRIILEVDERDITDAAVGQRGQLTLSALPGQPLPLTVERVTPVAIAEDGRNFFRVEASLEGPTPDLRPGMEGVAKIEVGERRLLWIWTHSLVDWLRLWTWTWLP